MSVAPGQQAPVWRRQPDERHDGYATARWLIRTGNCRLSERDDGTDRALGNFVHVVFDFFGS
jgi:hypothetical protein